MTTFLANAGSTNGGKMKRCAIYARYSTDKQDVQSIETQLMMCRREVARAGWHEVLCFTDAAESAATMHRPGMKALLAAVDRRRRRHRLHRRHGPSVAQSGRYRDAVRPSQLSRHSPGDAQGRHSHAAAHRHDRYDQRRAAERHQRQDPRCAGASSRDGKEPRRFCVRL
ncbi:recombinase family protein [Sphingomonas sp. CFBP 13714]|nr:recombinase family protein [Sphingomonas sp. CFBP 13714]